MWPFNLERYNLGFLYIYDILVLSFVNTYVWRCPTEENMLALYKRHVGREHCDIGIGTGYYLNHLEFSDNTSVDLFDIETAPLASAESLLRRQHPNLKVRTRLHDILSNEELSRDTGYDSVGLTYLLHCLPGPGSRKVAIFPKIRDAMSPGGVVFGATVLGRGPWHSLAGGCLLRGLNWIRQFDNLSDTKVVFQRGLEDNFVDVKTWVIGSVLLFEARKSMN